MNSTKQEKIKHLGLTNAEAIESGIEEKRKEFVEQGSEVYAKT
jgi:hypothetical protein